jgi:uncharacterized membrane protein
MRIRRIFFTGLIVTLPLGVTIFVFKVIFETLDGLWGTWLTDGLRRVGVPLPEDIIIPGIGVIATLAIIFLVGLFTRNYLGRKLWEFGERIVAVIPGIRSVYNGAKQIIDTFASANTDAFSKVVMLEYPRKGVWCLAFITGRTEGEAQQRTERDLVNIFLPTTPNPTSGFLLLVPREDLIELSMSVEEGVKMIVSGGVVTPSYDPKVAQIKGSISPPFVIEEVKTRVDDNMVKKLSAGHDGVIKVVVDVKQERMVAGAEWHNQLRDYLVATGSDEADCWGAKLDSDTGAVAYIAQINEGREGVNGSTLTEPVYVKTIETLIKKRLRP